MGQKRTFRSDLLYRSKRSFNGRYSLVRTPQIEGHRIFQRVFGVRYVDDPASVAVVLEATAAARFCLVGIDWESLVVTAARMDNVIHATAERTAVPGVHDVEDQWCIEADSRLQTCRQIPSLEPHAGNIFARAASRRQRHAATVASYGVTVGVQPRCLDLQPLEGGINKTHRAAGHILVEDMPGLDRLAQLQRDASTLDGAVDWETELPLRLEPDRIEGVTGASEIIQYVQEIFPNEMLEHEAVVKRSAPTRRLAIEWHSPEPGNERAQQQLLRQTHACVRRHFERPQL